MKKLMVMAAVALGCAAGAMADTAFAYQGNLRKDDGSPYSNETFTVTIGLYDKQESGTCLWIRESSARTSEDGTFNIEIGDNNTVPEGQSSSYLKDALARSEPCYLELQVVRPGLGATAQTVTPRQKVLSVPRALFADNVKEAQGDFSVTGCATFQHGIIVKGTDNKTVLQFSPSTDNNRLTVGSMQMNSASADGMTINQDLAVGRNAVVAGQLTVTNIVVSEAISVGQDMTVGGGLTVKGKSLSAPNAAMTVNSLAVSSANFTVNKAAVVMPVGTVVMWYGSEDDVPDGWAICNGQTIDGFKTPDLTGRFIVGAGGSNFSSKYASDDGSPYTLVKKDGELTASKGGSRQVALTKGQMPNHYHLSANDYAVAGHLLNDNWNIGKYHLDPADKVKIGIHLKQTDSGSDGRIYRTGTAGGDATEAKAGNDGNAESHENRPPYFALYYIIKVK